MSSSTEVPDPDQAAHAVGDSSRSDPLLEALVGRPREEGRAHGVGSDAVKLVNLVDSAVVNSTPAAGSVGMVEAPKGKKAKKARGYRRTDWVNAIVAGVAVVVVAATAVFTGVQVASADPSANAVEILSADEASLAGAEKSLAAAITRLEESIATGLTDSALIRAALGGLATTGTYDATADPAALATAVHAVDTYRAALEQTTVPAPPSPYERGTVDEESLASVGEAIDQVQEASNALDEASRELRATRAAVDALRTTYANQLATFAQTLTVYAGIENEAHPVAEQSFRDAVTAAATAVTAAPLDGASGAAALTAFRDAVLALREDDRRASEAEEREREQSRNDQSTPSPDSGESNPGPTDPVPTDPVPTDPVPTDPVPTDPAPTDPGGDGGAEG